MSQKGVKYIWKKINNKINNHLRQIGVGTKHIGDYNNAIALIVRRTFKIKTMRDIDPIADEVELFVLELMQVIERRVVGEEKVLQD